MMMCDKCGSKRVASLNAHSKDLSDFVSPEDGVYSENTYFPDVENICSGDDAQMDICLECGKVQGDFPVKIGAIEGEFPVGKLRAAIENELDDPTIFETESELDALDDIRVLIKRQLNGVHILEDWEIADTFEEEHVVLINKLLGSEY